MVIQSFDRLFECGHAVADVAAAVGTGCGVCFLDEDRPAVEALIGGFRGVVVVEISHRRFRLRRARLITLAVV